MNYLIGILALLALIWFVINSVDVSIKDEQ
jgi:hypothetical protein